MYAATRTTIAPADHAPSLRIDIALSGPPVAEPPCSRIALRSTAGRGL
jgi:hypothetical protein